MNHCNKTRTTSLKIVFFFFSLKTGSKHEQKLKAIYKVNKKTEEKKNCWTTNTDTYKKTLYCSFHRIWPVNCRTKRKSIGLEIFTLKISLVSYDTVILPSKFVGFFSCCCCWSIFFRRDETKTFSICNWFERAIQQQSKQFIVFVANCNEFSDVFFHLFDLTEVSF